VDSPSPLQARNWAAVEGVDAGAQSCEGYELDQEAANLIPAAAIGRMLNRQEVRELIRELEMRAIGSREPPATSNTACVCNMPWNMTGRAQKEADHE
jgi:hypothetical protein